MIHTDSSFQYCPEELLLHIFSFADSCTLSNVSQVCKKWQRITGELNKHALPETAFGKKKWSHYLADVKQTPLQNNLHDIWEDPCPFREGKKIKETHILCLIPDTTNGKPFTLKSLQTLVAQPQNGPTATLRYPQGFIWKKNKGALDQTMEKATWVLMTKEGIPLSPGKSYSEQEKILNDKGYQIPTGLVAATCIFAHFLDSEEKLNENSMICCQNTKESCVLLGNFNYENPYNLLQRLKNPELKMSIIDKKEIDNTFSLSAVKMFNSSPKNNKKKKLTARCFSFH